VIQKGRLWLISIGDQKNCIIETFVDDESYQEQLEAEDEKMNAYLTKHYKSDEE